MPRPVKNTVDYFSHDCDAQNRRTLTILQFKYKNDGYATWFKLLEILGSTNGHILDCRNTDTWEFLQAKTLVEGGLLVKILDTCAEIDAIDKVFWQNKLIWCQNFVNRLDSVYKNRDQPLPQKPVLLPNNPTTDVVSTGNNPTTDVVSTDNNTQSKVKYSIVNNITVPCENKKNGYHEIFDFWNTQKIVVHEKITDKMQTAIRNALKDHSSQDIQTAIQNYATILKSPEYYFKYEWELKDFLNRGLDKFIDIERAKRNYLKDKPIQPPIVSSEKKPWRVR